MKLKNIRSLGFIFIILSICTVSFLYNFKPGHLHDIAHYITAGISYIRDSSDLIYPYKVGKSQDHSYEKYIFNKNTTPFRVNYPSKLYSIIISIPAYLSGTVTLLGSGVVTYICFTASSALLFFTISKLTSNKNVAFVITALCIFSPTIGATLSHSNDIIGVLGISSLLYIISKNNQKHDIISGVLIGLIVHLRPQNIILLPISVILSALMIDKWSWKKGTFKILLGFCAAFIVIKILLISFISKNKTREGDFYLEHFSQSFYKISECKLIGEKINKNANDFWHYDEIGIITVASFLIMIMMPSKGGFGLFISGMIWIALPFITYSFDRYSGPHLRYYAASIPLFYLSILVSIINNKKTHKHLTKVLVILCVYAILKNKKYFSESFWKSAPTSLDYYVFPKFVAAPNQCKNVFTKDSVIVSNHSLASAFFGFNRVFGLPERTEFVKINNSNLDGMIIFYSKENPDAFFNDKSWASLYEDSDIISDNFGNTFYKVISESSNLGYGNRIIIVTIYKKISSASR